MDKIICRLPFNQYKLKLTINDIVLMHRQVGVYFCFLMKLLNLLRPNILLQGCLNLSTMSTIDELGEWCLKGRWSQKSHRAESIGYPWQPCQAVKHVKPLQATPGTRAHQPWEKPLASIVLCLTDAVVPKLTSMLNRYKHLALLFTYPREMISRVVACIVLW